jgi:hypothetical protein
MGAKFLKSVWGLALFVWICKFAEYKLLVIPAIKIPTIITLVAIGCTLILLPWIEYLKGPKIK